MARSASARAWSDVALYPDVALGPDGEIKLTTPIAAFPREMWKSPDGNVIAVGSDCFRCGP